MTKDEANLFRGSISGPGLEVELSIVSAASGLIVSGRTAVSFSIDTAQKCLHMFDQIYREQESLS